MELIQRGIAGVLLAGGIGVAGYYASGGPSGITIQEYILSKKRGLITSTDTWKEKGQLYKGVEGEGLISGLINRDKRVGGKTKEVWESLKEWCEKTQKKYYTGIHDTTYQNFSIWCLSKLTIKIALTNEGLKEETDWDKKFQSYEKKGEKFIKAKPQVPPAKEPASKIDKNRMSEWCKEEQEKDFKHEAFGEYYRVKEWCFEDPNAKPKVE